MFDQPTDIYGGCDEDFAKAFDKVPHHRLIGKVASMGIEGRVKGCIQQ